MLPNKMFLVHPDNENSGPARTTLSFRNSPTVLLTFLANRYTRLVSKVYLQKFGLGVMDWRMLVMLARDPGSSVSHASRTIGIDKAAVSRCLRRLADRKLAKISSIGTDERRKEWVLTAQGGHLHDQILQVALTAQQNLLAGFSEKEVLTLNKLLSRMLKNLESKHADAV